MESPNVPRCGGGDGGSESPIPSPSCTRLPDIIRSFNLPRGRGPDSSATFRGPLIRFQLFGASVTRWTPRIVIIATIALLLSSRPGWTQSDRGRRGSIVIVTGQLGTLAVPTLIEGPARSVSNMELSDQLFLRLAGLGPSLLTAGDRDFVPLLARSWTRRDSLTLVFDLDPRARWQDGTPVSARDVVFIFKRAKNPAVAPRLVDLLRRIASVTAEGDRRVVFRFS